MSTSIHELARMRLLVQAYNNFLGNKNILLTHTDSQVIPDTGKLEAEFMQLVMNKMLQDEPCKEHTLVLTETTPLYRIKTYRCLNCAHIELKD